MTRRPIDARFEEAVLTGRKFTTIRDKSWPVGVPIMLFRWSEKPYRSPQINVAEVVVTGFWPMLISRTDNGMMVYAHGMESDVPLWHHEGFPSQEAMSEWFRPMVKPGEHIAKVMMRFRLMKPTNREIP